MDSLEHVVEVVEVDHVFVLLQRGSVDQGHPVDPLGALQGVALDDFLQEHGEVLLLFGSQTHSHPDIDEDDFYLFLVLFDQLRNIFLVFIVLLTEFPEGLRVKTVFDELGNKVIFSLIKNVPGFSGDLVRLVFDSDQDVASVAVGMNKVVLHQHCKKGFGS